MLSFALPQPTEWVGEMPPPKRGVSVMFEMFCCLEFSQYLLLNRLDFLGIHILGDLLICKPVQLCNLFLCVALIVGLTWEEIQAKQPFNVL